MKSAGLQTIFAVFLGLMVAAFVGVGVYTFHPSPQTTLDRQIEAFNRREQAIRNSGAPDELTAADRREIQAVNDERNKVIDAAREAREAWGRSTSIILMVFATLAMAVSILRAEQLPVISNGVLLGGVFTMIYGVGWIIATDTSIARFMVMTTALAITLGLGHLRFARRRSDHEQAASRAGSTDLRDLEQRVRDLEDRMNEAASAFAKKRNSSVDR
jgi:hypothetical protein